MSKKSWQETLQAALKRVKKSDRSPRVAIVGIGHELCGDDAAGLHLACTLRTLAADNEWLLIIEAGPAPENFCGTLRRFYPDLVVLADAAQMGMQPGTVRWLPWQETTGLSASTHTLPLHILAKYLTAELGCEVALLGIQPAQNFNETLLTPAVKDAAEATAKTLAETLQVM